jgi:hypothetical protein
MASVRPAVSATEMGTRYPALTESVMPSGSAGVRFAAWTTVAASVPPRVSAGVDARPTGLLTLSYSAPT